MANFNYGEMLAELEKTQALMLDLQVDAARKPLQSWYKNSIKHFTTMEQRFKPFQKNDPQFLSKSQCNLILKNLKIQNDKISNSTSMADKEIIELFEKQLRLKKIIRKFAENLNCQE
jgi:hypothetical protein